MTTPQLSTAERVGGASIEAVRMVAVLAGKVALAVAEVGIALGILDITSSDNSSQYDTFKRS